MANQKKHRWLPYLMVLPAFSIMVLVVVFPIAVSYTHLTLPTTERV